MGNEITVATREQEALGIDRIFKTSTGETITIDYKTDPTTERTGNVFVETVSIDRPPEKISLGWAVKSQADFIYYYVPQKNEVCIVRTARIRAVFPKWIATYRKASATNKTWKTWGILVPYADFVALGRLLSVPPYPAEAEDEWVIPDFDIEPPPF